MRGFALLRAVVAALVCCLLCAAFALAEEPRWGRLYTAVGNVAVRESPDAKSLKVRVLKGGQKVRIDFQDDGWGAAFDPKEQTRSELKAMGYVRMAELIPLGGAESAQPLPPAAPLSPKPAAEPKGQKNASPVKPEAKPDAKGIAKSDPKTSARTDAKASAKPEAAKPEAAKTELKAEHKTEHKAAVKNTAKGFGELRVADRSLAVRGARDKDSEFRRLLKPGQRVRVDFWEDGWFAVFDPEEKTRDISKAWGFSRDRFLVPEGSFAGVPPEAVSNVPSQRPESLGGSLPVAQASAAKETKAQGDVGYSVVFRKADKRKPPTVTLRVRLDLPQPPGPDVLRSVAREIWKAERKKDENLLLEIILGGMDADGLAYATARFHEDGRLREFWWRDVVLGKAKK